MPLLHPGDTFPDIDLHLPAGETVRLPQALGGTFGIVLFNRGAWCPFCTAQLRGFERAGDQLRELGAAVVSLSVDDEATTKEMVTKNNITFLVGHSANAHQVSQATGAFLNPDPVYLQETGFVLDPQGKVLVSAYSSGAIGRLMPEDVVGLVTYLQGHS